MAQYYQIVGGHSLTLEELQRYCPNVCLDGVVVNDENHYGQQSVVVQRVDSHNEVILSEGGQSKIMVGDNIQYQQPYIIRHEQQQMATPQQPQASSASQPEFRQQQLRQQIQQHQVYYATQADKQVVLEEAQKIIDASLLQQQEQQRQQHMVTPNHVPTQPTVIHPAQQPPPQPPPPPPLQLTHVAAQPVQQQGQQHIGRASQSPHLIQQLQQQHQIQIQQQLHQHAQSQQQHVQSQQQHAQAQQQHTQVQQQHAQVQQQHAQVQHHPVQQQQQQRQQVMSYQVGTPPRPGQPRMLTHPIATPGGVSLVRHPGPGGGKMVRPRNRPARPTGQRPPLQRPQIPGSPGLVHAVRAPRATSPRMAAPQGPRIARPVTPSQQQPPQQIQQLLQQSQQHPPQLQQQLTHTQLQQLQMQQQQQQQVMPQRMHSPQIDHLKLAQHQRLINQQHNQTQARRVGSPGVQVPSQPTRIITPQGIIVQQLNQMQQPNQGNSPAPQQNSQVLLSQRSSPALPRKVVAAPNNASDMDDLEDSITAAVLQKNPPEAQQYNNTNDYSQPPPLVPTNAPQFSFGQQFGQQKQVYDQPQHQYNQMMDEQHTDDEQIITLANNQRMTMAEYKRLQQAQQIGCQQQIVRKETQRPVQRVMPMQTHQQLHENNEGTIGISEQNAELQSAKMLIFLENGEQRLITFTLPKESCTVQEVLEQVNVPYSDDIHCMQNHGADIDYVVTIGRARRDEIETHPMFNGEINGSSPTMNVTAQSTSEQSTPEKIMEPSTEGSPEVLRTPQPKYIDGKLAVCKCCGYTGYDFTRCQRCRRLFPEEPKSVTIVSKSEEKKKEVEKPQPPVEKPVPIAGEIKLNLLKSVKSVKNNTTEKKVAKPRKGRKQPEPEPVILTLSSDDEDSNGSFVTQNELSISMKEPSLSEIEGGTPDSGIGFDHDDDSDPLPGVPALTTSLQCRTIRIGSYRFTPKENIIISSRGVKVVAPCIKDGTKEVALQIHHREIVKLLAHYGKGLPVIFLYTMSVCGNYIREQLDMSEDSGPYYNPVSKQDAIKRITLLPEFITDETKLILKKLFGRVMDELNAQEANEILVKSCSRDNSPTARMILRSSAPASTSANKSSNNEIRQILIYPPGKGGISINTEDFMCLAQDQFLNDVIIDFYLKHLLHDVLTDSQRVKTHIFSTFFYKRLTTKPSHVNKTSNPHEWDNSLSPAQKRHARVKTWTKNVNIFEKDFVIVPINENCHWFVAIICFPSLDGCRSMLDNRNMEPQEVKKKERRTSIQIGSTTITQIAKQELVSLNCDSDSISERDEAEAEESDLDMQCDSDDEDMDDDEKSTATPNEPIKQPCIIICDSLAGTSRSRVAATLRDYLTCEYNAKISASKKFTKDNLKGACPKVPQQTNFTDCGLYLLQYVESFFLNPITDYTFPLKHLGHWFDEIIVTRKREDISNLIKTFIKRYNPDSNITLPDIQFPTINGKLLDLEEQECESEEDKLSEEGTVPPTRLTLVKQSSGDIVLKRSITTESGDSVHVRKSIRLANCTDGENRNFVQINHDFIKKGNSEAVIIPLKIHSDLVRDLQNSLIKSKSGSEKKNSVNNQNASSVNSHNESEITLKTMKVLNRDDSSDENNKKLKKNDC